MNQTKYLYYPKEVSKAKICLESEDGRHRVTLGNITCDFCGLGAVIVDEDILYIPTIKGQEYHLREEPNVLFYGGRGGAKSTTGRWDAHIRALMYPGFTYVILRRTFPELQRALELDTPIPTPTGFKRMGDIYPGDFVIAPDGAAVVVTHASLPTIDPHGTFRITFDNGETLIASAGHKWVVQTAQQRHAARRLKSGRQKTSCTDITPQIVTTLDIHNSLRVEDGKRSNYSIATAKAWDAPEQVLPVDPYVLGAWLGDGTRNQGAITSIDQEILDNITAAGYVIRKRPSHIYEYGILGLKHDLRRAGVILDKHIPDIYFCGSATQRLALLQGLMDTDGCAKTDGLAIFANTNVRLSDAVFVLAASLGLKPRKKTSLTRRRDGSLTGTTTFWVYWTSTTPVFRLARKRLRLPKELRGVTNQHYIVACERIEDRLCKCIAVEHPSHQYLAGYAAIPTHNSHLSFIDYEMSKLGGTFHHTDKIAIYPNGSRGTFAHCYDAETEVLTKRGFLLFKDLVDTDQLASLNLDNGELEYHKPLERQTFAYKGPAVRFKSLSIDFLVTPDHPVLMFNADDLPVVVCAQDLAITPRGRQPKRFRRTALWSGVELESVTLLPPTRLASGGPSCHVERVLADEWFEFLGWYLSEGSATKYTRASDSLEVYCIQIAQKKHPQTITRLASMLKCWGFTPHVTTRVDGVQVLRVTQKQLFENLAHFGKSNEKYVPDCVKNASSRQIQIFLSALLAGDGTWDSKRGIYECLTTTSKRLADDVQELLLKVGLVGTLGAQRNRFGRLPYWIVNITHSRQEPCFDAQYVTRESYDGLVYDVTMPASPTLLIRRNGKICWGHNCQDDKDVLKLLSAEYGLAVFDELTTFEWEMFLKLAASVRVPVGSGYKALVRGLTNPLGVSASEVLQYFVTKDVDPETNIDYNPHDWHAIKANLGDNPHLDKTEYLKRFTGFSVAVRKAWIEGEFVDEAALFDFKPTVEGQSYHVINEMPTIGGRYILEYAW